MKHKKIDAGLLRRLGYRPGKARGWCVTCAREVEGMAPEAFKCIVCARAQAKRLERECREHYGADNDGQ